MNETTAFAIGLLSLITAFLVMPASPTDFWSTRRSVLLYCAKGVLWTVAFIGLSVGIVKCSQRNSFSRMSDIYGVCFNSDEKEVNHRLDSLKRARPRIAMTKIPDMRVREKMYDKAQEEKQEERVYQCGFSDKETGEEFTIYYSILFSPSTEDHDAEYYCQIRALELHNPGGLDVSSYRIDAKLREYLLEPSHRSYHGFRVTETPTRVKFDATERGIVRRFTVSTSSFENSNI